MEEREVNREEEHTGLENRTNKLCERNKSLGESKVIGSEQSLLPKDIGKWLNTTKQNCIFLKKR
jgi:hypothetical protein